MDIQQLWTRTASVYMRVLGYSCESPGPLLRTTWMAAAGPGNLPSLKLHLDLHFGKHWSNMLML